MSNLFSIKKLWTEENVDKREAGGRIIEERAGKLENQFNTLKSRAPRTQRNNWWIL